MSTVVAETESLRRTGEELREGQNKLRGMVDRVRREEASLTESAGILQVKKAELEKMIEQVG